MAEVKIIEAVRGTQEEREMERNFRQNLDRALSGKWQAPTPRPKKDPKDEQLFRAEAVAGRALDYRFKVLMHRFGYRFFPPNMLPHWWDHEAATHRQRETGEWRHTCRGVRRQNCVLCKYAFSDDELIANWSNDVVQFAAFLDERIAKHRRQRISL